MEEQNTTEAASIAALAVMSADVKSAAEGAAPFVVVPEGCDVRDLESHLQQPIRKRGTFNVRDVESFIAIVKAQATDATVLYRTVEPPCFKAVFNDHGAAGSTGPGWGDHQAVYSCPLSPEWRTWTAGNKRQMSQADFAQFIEDNLPDIASTEAGDPTAAQMLEVSRTLQAKKKVNFASAIRLDNGEQQFTYEEKIDGTAGGKGQIRVPEVFKIGVPVFEGGPRYAVKARLRYRIGDNGSLALWFDLERPHKIVEHAVDELKKAVEEGAGRKTLNGSRD